ncbi:MAG: HD domain-containing protein [Alphaproteobacteria bacterium]|nr:HD domain-containing protein [Alphaproteobacteria bacterium]
MNIKERTVDYFESLAKPFLENKNLSDDQKTKVDIKYSHPYRVAKLSEEFADYFNMSKEDADMFYVIALLHDVGRFEQIKVFNSFSDKDTMDHGDLSERVISELDFIKNHFSTEDFDIICKAIKNHNKLTIDNKITDDRTLYFCKMIRDIDKLDIYKVYIEDIYEKGNLDSVEGKGKGNPREVSSDVFQSVLNKEEVPYTLIRTQADKLILSLGYIFDINYKYSFEILKKNGYYDKLISVVEEKVNEFDKLKSIYIDFINEKLEI